MGPGNFPLDRSGPRAYIRVLLAIGARHGRFQTVASARVGNCQIGVAGLY
jgi:hypothetical protein